MGKSTMGLGQYRGKVGGLVFRKGDDGQQVISAYQPIVKNPRSDAQLKQRAKFNLAQQIARQVPLSFIYSLGNTSVKRRGAFLSNIIKAATAVRNGDAYDAHISGSSVVISRGPSASLMAPIASWDPAQQAVAINWTDIDGVNGWNASDKVSVLIGIFSGDGSVKPEFFPVPDAAEMSTRTAVYSVPTSMVGSNFKAMAWVFATRQSSNVTSASGSGSSVPNNNIAASLTLGTGLANLEYSDSMFAGVFALEG